MSESSYNARITQRMVVAGTYWFSFSEGKVLTCGC
jgi:hypothetical protein